MMRTKTYRVKLIIRDLLLLKHCACALWQGLGARGLIDLGAGGICILAGKNHVDFFGARALCKNPIISYPATSQFVSPARVLPVWSISLTILTDLCHP